jgi:MATE family multidrug resistance protein
MSEGISNRARRQVLLKVAWPLIINSGSFALLNFFDRLFLSWYSEAAFRASLPGGILFFTFVCGFMALAGITNTFVAQLIGGGDEEGCATATSQGIFFALLSIPLIFLLQPIGIGVLRWVGHAPEVLQLEETYFSILLFCGGGMVLSSAFSSFFSGRGCTRMVMGCNILANGINIFMNYLFVFGVWGLPEMGIAGAAWASVIGSWSAPLFFAIVYFNRKHRKRFGTWKRLRFDRELFVRMFRFGLPSGFHFFTEVAAFTVFVLLIGRLGGMAHVAGNIALSINLIAFMPMIGMGIAASILVGQSLGRNEPEEATRYGWTALRMGLVYIGSIGLTFLLFPQLYLNIFSAEAGSLDPDQLRSAVSYLLIILAIWGLPDAASLIFSGALKGAGDTHFVMRYQAVVAWGIFVPGELILIVGYQAHHLVCWAWALLYITLLGVGYTWRFASGRWKTIKLLRENNRVPTLPLAPGADLDSL